MPFLTMSTKTPLSPVAIGAAGKERNFVQRLSFTIVEVDPRHLGEVLAHETPTAMHLVEQLDHLLGGPKTGCRRRV